MSAAPDKSDLRRAFMEMAELGLATRRQEARLRSRVRRLGRNLILKRNGRYAVAGFVVVDRYTTLCELHAASLDDVEAWLVGQPRRTRKAAR